MALQESLDVFMGDFSVACSKGAVQFAGILDTPNETLAFTGVNVLSTMYQLTVKSVDASTAVLRSGDAITVAGVAFVVRDVMPQDDGAFSFVSLSKP